MTNSERDRLVAWDLELRSAHERLRGALRVASESAADGAGAAASRDLLLYCQGFCVALSAHHVGEDRRLFPVLLAEHPLLSELIGKLEQDHRMIAHLLTQLEDAVSSTTDAATLALHLEGLAAIMESHFRFEERELLGILETIELDADPHRVLGPL